MKKLIVLFCLLVTSAIKAQAPQYLNYQGIARDAGGTIITTAIGVKFEILQGSASGTVVYDETNTITPSSAGIFTTAIGSGAPGIGTFSSINWANGPYFIRINIDPAGGTSYSTVGTSQLLSVPYALYAEKAGNAQTFTAGNGITINSGTITNSAPNQTVNISGSGVTGSYPNYTVSSGATPTAGNGISIISGTITNTAPDQTVTISGATGTYPNFTVTSSPATTITPGNSNIAVTGASPNYTISSVPTLSLSGAQLSISNGNTVTLPTGTTYTNGAGIALTSGTIITNTAPNQTVNISGPGVVGSYPNYTVTAPAATTLTGVGVASVSGTSPNYTVTVPGPSLTVSGNSLTITQGTVSVTKTITTSPWLYNSGILSPINNPTNDKVAIGQSSASSLLDVSNAAGSTLTTTPVSNIVNNNTTYTASAVLAVKNNAGAAAVVNASNASVSGDGIDINMTNGSNNGNALQVQHFGTGSAGYFSINNPINNSIVIQASTNGLNSAIYAMNSNSANVAGAINATSNGNMGLYVSNTGASGIGGSFNTIGTAVYGTNSGAFNTIQAQNTNASPGAYAGHFTGGVMTIGKSSTNSDFAFKALNSSSNDLFNVRDDGNVGINVTSPGYRLSVNENSGALAAIYGTQSSAAGSANAHGVQGLTSNTNTFAAGVYGESSGSGPGVFGRKSVGTGPAGRFEIASSTMTADGLFAINNGGGAAIHAVNGPTVAGSSNAAVWLESGHLKSTQGTAPTTTTISVSGGGVQGVSVSLTAGSTDVKGVMNAVLTTTGQINSGNSATFRVNFNKAYTVAPVVVVTSLTDLGLTHLFITNVTTTSFNLTVKNSTSGSMSAAASFPMSFNYMVIE